MICGTLYGVVCPHCGAKNSWEAHQDAYATGDCDACGQSFEVYAEFIVQKSAPAATTEEPK